MVDILGGISNAVRSGGRLVRTLLIAAAALSGWAATISNISTATETSDHGRVRITANTDTAGWVQVQWDVVSHASGGSYAYLTDRYLTADPQLAFSGGGCTREPQGDVYALAGNSITVNGIATIDPGAGCTSTPTITITSFSGGTGAVVTPNMCGGSVCGNTSAGYTVVSAGSGYNCSGNGGCGFNSTQNQIALAIGGLNPATGYYYRILVCPDANDNTGCTITSEQTFTTAPDPGHPVFPTAPVSPYNPVALNMSSGYTIVPMACSGSTITASASVGPVSYGGSAPGPTSSWSVALGDSLQTVLNEVGYGADIQLPSGGTCAVPATLAMPTLSVDPQATGGSIDASNHRFIVIETAPTSSTDFPPFGFRISPSWHGLSKLANLQATVPANTGNPGQGASQIAIYASQSSSYPVHHIWIQNVEVSVLTSASNGPWSPYFQVGIAQNGWANDMMHPPDYNVWEHVYAPGATLPVETTRFLSGTPKHIAILDSWADSIDCGGACVQGIYFTTGSQGPFTISNIYLSARYQGIYLEHNGGDSCLYVNGNTYTGVGGILSCPAYYDNQFVKNTLHWPSFTLYNTNWATGWDGNQRQFRNQFEFKGCRRCVIKGNTIDGQWSYQNEGSAIFMSLAGGTDITGTNTTGTTDILIQSNIIRNSSAVFNSFGDSNFENTTHGDQAQNARITFKNNLAYNLGRYRYAWTGNSPGLVNAYFPSAPGTEDLNIINNTLGFSNSDSGTNTYIYIPAIFLYGQGSTMGEGNYVQNNVFYVSSNGPSYGAVNDSSWEGGYCCSNFIPNPLVSGSTASAIVNSADIRVTSSGVTPNVNWGGNIDICGTLGTYGGAEPWPDMNQSTCNTIAANMPPGDSYPQGSTVSARTLAAGFANAANNDYTCTASKFNACAAGVDFEALKSDLGIVSNILVHGGPGALELDYVAPDTNACSVDLSSDGINWTRTTDSGGERVRELTIPGLSPGISYSYRILCYYDQTDAWFSFPSEPTSMVTDGVYSTAAAGTRNLALSFQMPSHAANARFTLTPIGGSGVTQTCSASPCNVSNAPLGDLKVSVAYLSSSGSVISSGSFFVP